MHDAVRDNVTDIRTRVSSFPQDSTLYFPVVERKLAWEDRRGNHHRVDNHKALIRVNDAGNPQQLAIVGDKYRIVKNNELFPYIESSMQQAFEPHLLRDVSVRDSMSYGGRDCYREYVFNNMRCDIDGGGNVAFRLIIGNSYGAKAIQLISGAIDFFCTNGMIIGAHERAARKHTSGVTVRGLDRWVHDSVTAFTGHVDRMQQWSHTDIPHAHENGLFTHLVGKGLASERHASQLNTSMHYERNRHAGRDNRPTLWHLYSAMTQWSSHSEVRNTGNDHEANTRIGRARHVQQMIDASAHFIKKVAA